MRLSAPSSPNLYMKVEASEKAKTEQMGFNELAETNQKLFQNPDLSEHNKQVLEEFSSASTSRSDRSAIQIAICRAER